MVTTQSADNVLKSYYLDVVSDQLNKEVNPLLARIKQTTADVWGRDVRKAVRLGLNGGIGAGTESGALPKAGGTRYAQFVSTLKNLYGTIEITDKAIRASQSNEGAFVNLLNDEMDSLVKSSSFNFGRMLFGDGTGKLAKIMFKSGQEYEVDTVKNLAEGMVVDIYRSGDDLVASGVTVKSVDREGRLVGFYEEFETSGAESYIYLQNSKDLEISGLGAIFGDAGTLYGVDRSENPWLKPYMKSVDGGLLETELQKAIDAVEEKSGGKINFIVCSWGVRRELIKEWSKYRQIDTIDLEGGFKALSYNGIPIVADRFCPKGTMDLLNTDDFALHQLCDWQWLEGEDGKILKQIAGKPVYTATLVKYAELMCYRPCGQAMLTNIYED